MQLLTVCYLYFGTASSGSEFSMKLSIYFVRLVHFLQNSVQLTLLVRH